MEKNALHSPALYSLFPNHYEIPRAVFYPMVLRIRFRDCDSLQVDLVRLLGTEAVHGWKVLVIDCGNTLTNHIFSQKEMKGLFSRIQMKRVENMEGLMDFVFSLPKMQEGKDFHMLILSPWEHLLGDLLPIEEKRTVKKMEEGLARIEKAFPVHAVVMEIG